MRVPRRPLERTRGVADLLGVDVAHGTQLPLFRVCAGPGCTEHVTGNPRRLYCSRRCLKQVHMLKHGDRINEERRERERLKYATDPQWRATRLAREKARYLAAPERFKAQRDKRQAEMGEELRRRDRERYAADPSGKKAAARRWVAKNPAKAKLIQQRRRAVKQAAESRRVTPRELAHLRHRQRSACFYCEQVKPLTIEHLIPLTRGGRNSIGNYVLACASCNASKGNRLVIEYRLGRKREHGRRRDAAQVSAVPGGHPATDGSVAAA